MPRSRSSWIRRQALLQRDEPRLAFAVAAHLEPEIQLVDEVVAVGDAEFQEKCLGRMSAVAHEGRTVLFVSHNMEAVQSLCGRAIWLDNGTIVQEGKSAEVISSCLHVSPSGSVTAQVWEDVHIAPGNDVVRLHRVSVHPESGLPCDSASMETPLVTEVEYWNLVPVAKLHVTLHFHTEQRVAAFTTGSSVMDPAWQGRPLSTGLFRRTCQIPGRFLNRGTYRILFLIMKDGSRVIHRHEDVLSFDILDLSERRLGSWYGKEPGAARPILQWTTERLDDV